LYHIAEFYQHFLTAKQSNELNTTLTITDQIKKLSEGLETLNSELQEQVRTQHSALLSQASHAGKQFYNYFDNDLILNINHNN
jgi:predicted DNA-binding protein YlxM (UPF0122 family)